MAGLLTVAGRVFHTLDFARCITTSALLTGRGIRGVVKGLGLQEEELQDLGPDDLEAMTDASLDTFNQETAHIEGDARRYQDHLRKKTIQHKYFKSLDTKEENLLTWSMKEQLKYLHSSDPNQWTPEVLSKAFPISPQGVVRLLQSHWKPKSDMERQKHDKAVVARWKKHMKGQLGSFRILEKTLNNKFVPENLPAPVTGMQQVLSILEDLQFDGEKPYVAKESKKKNKLPKQPKMPSKSFYSIIEDYENKSSKGEKTEQENTYTSSLTKISGAPQYEGSHSRVSGGDEAVRRHLPSRKRGKKLITFTEFMKKTT